MVQFLLQRQVKQYLHFPEGFASQDGNVTINNENISGRMVAPYAGITTTLASNVNSQTPSFDITGLGEFKNDVKIGDYLQINNEN